MWVEIGEELYNLQYASGVFINSYRKGRVVITWSFGGCKSFNVGTLEAAKELYRFILQNLDQAVPSYYGTILNDT